MQGIYYFFEGNLCILKFDFLSNFDNTSSQIEVRRENLSRVFSLCLEKSKFFDLCQIYLLSVPCQTLISRILVFYKYFCQENCGELQIFCKTEQILNSLLENRFDCLLGEDAIKLM